MAAKAAGRRRPQRPWAGVDAVADGGTHLIGMEPRGRKKTRYPGLIQLFQMPLLQGPTCLCLPPVGSTCFWWGQPASGGAHLRFLGLTLS